MKKMCCHSWCKSEYTVSEEDLNFYKKISPTIGNKIFAIDPPKTCPDCREQRRFSWRNDRTMSKKNCNNCKKNVVAIIPENSDVPVLCNTCWWSDYWDPIEYGSTYNPNESIFTQLHALIVRTPHIAIMNDNGVNSENCVYCQDFVYGKNCYFCNGTWRMENCSHCHQCDYSKYISDCNTVFSSELCYECIDSQNLYNCIFLQNSESCTDCSFGFDLRGCKNCFYCIGLRQKQYCYKNIQYSKEEYIKIVSLETRNIYTIYNEFSTWHASFPHKNLNMQNCEDSLGEHLFHCKSLQGYTVLRGEYSKWITRCTAPKYCYDVLQSGAPELCYECWTVDESYKTCFSMWANRCKDTYYSIECDGCEHIFGCIGLQKMKYCILNTQYTKQEYENLLPQLIQKMKDDGEWGEFLPSSMSIFGYNQTAAQENFPLTKEECEQRGYSWYEAKETKPSASKFFEASSLPKSIQQTPDEILDWHILCPVSGRYYKIVKQELELYRKMNIPVPTLCPDERHLRRARRRNQRTLWDRLCAQCSKSIITSYAPNNPEIVYCEECYLKKVY